MVIDNGYTYLERQGLDYTLVNHKYDIRLGLKIDRFKNENSTKTTVDN